MLQRACSTSRHVLADAPSTLFAALLFPTQALAHASDRGHILLLPTGHYLVGGAAAVAISFLALAVLPRRALGPLAARRLPLVMLPSSLPFWTNLASFAFLCVLIAAGIFGSRDPLSNPLPLAIWTMLWVGLTLIVGVFGNFWSWIDPWYAPVRMARRLFSKPHLAYPKALGYWPAVVLFAGFAWFELIDIAPDDPYRLAIAVASYWLLTFGCMLAFGYEPWSRQAEFLSVFFRMISRLGIIETARDASGRLRLALCAPAAKLWREEPLPLSGAVFLLAALGSVSFDGFSKTFAWLGLIGVNPLEYPGRSAVQGANTVGLLLFCAGLIALFLAAVSLGARVGKQFDRRVAAGRLVWSIVPIALAYHFSHYLTAFLVNAQYFVVALSDPFGLGWDLFGTAHMLVSAGITMGSESAWVIWNLQAFAIIAGHVLALVIAHALAAEPDAPPRTVWAELPLTLLMIGYTVFGLWLLSTPTAG
ncbi:hypothetical protein [Pseudaminobacter soli (ex Zhang et al. 2022)]|uniref:hypothetical protein n=1 Tax=Pseudaminobacter soli (ex Zhang et al. 2022) TaxID=2831468 RepID=UPI0030805B8E